MTSQPAQLKEKRGVASGRRRRLLLLLVASLQGLQAQYPELHHEIQKDIDAHLSQADRTGAADRRDVLQALEEWQSLGLTVEEIIGDTGLSERTVRSTLEELLATDPPLVTLRERAPDGERGRRARVFFTFRDAGKGRGGLPELVVAAPFLLAEVDRVMDGRP